MDKVWTTSKKQSDSQHGHIIIYSVNKLHKILIINMLIILKLSIEHGQKRILIL